MRLLRFVALAAAVSLATAGQAWAGAHEYLNPNFAAIAREHKTLAILPFTVTIAPHSQSGWDKGGYGSGSRAQTSAQLVDGKGRLFQKILCEFLSQRLMQKPIRNAGAVSIQDPDSTLALLRGAGISLDSLQFHGKDEIARVLGVDAVVSGSVHEPKPTLKDVTLSSVIGIFDELVQRVLVVVTVYNGGDAQVLWSYDRWDSGTDRADKLPKVVERMVESQLKKAAASIPYAK